MSTYNIPCGPKWEDWLGMKGLLGTYAGGKLPNRGSSGLILILFESLFWEEIRLDGMRGLLSKDVTDADFLPLS